MLRWIARVLVSVLIAIVLLGVFFNPAGRGFLGSTRRMLWLGLRTTEGRGWAVEVLSVGDDPPVPLLKPGTAAILVRMVESSMGRTDTGGFRRWRFSSWVIEGVRRADAPEDSYDEDATSLPPDADRALASFIEFELIPNSEAMAIWPHTPTTGVTRNDPSWWSTWQHRFNAPGAIIACVVCVMIGAGAGALVFRRGSLGVAGADERRRRAAGSGRAGRRASRQRSESKTRRDSHARASP